MKFSVALLSLISATAATKVDVASVDIKADSKIGHKLLSQARKLDQDEIDFTWVSGYSIKFQGCHHISQWNDEADGDEDVRIQTKRLVRFRLCPSDYCSAESSKGCSEGYGDYIIDLNTYLNAFFEAKNQYQEWKCEYLENNVCGCNDDDYCLWDCYEGHGMEDVCMDENPYNNNNNNNNNQEEEFDFELEKYMECAEAGFDNDNNYYYNYNYANNNNNGNGNNNNNEIEFFIGPYCSGQGGEIRLGVFTDDTCTQFADDNNGRDVFSGMTNGQSLPYSDTNIVDMDCFSCKEPEDNNNDGNDNYDEDEVTEMCEQIYQAAGKCETNLPYGTVYQPNTNACNYMEGIKIVRKDGTVVTADAKANKTASIFIGLFVVAFVLLSAYVYYLKTKLDRASINLSE